MSAFLQPWVSQPSHALPLNLSHKSARGIVGFITPWDKGAAVGAPTFSPRVNKNGPAIAHIGNGSSYLVKDVVGSITQDCSILVVANVGNIAGGGHIASIGTTSAGDQVFTLQSGPEFAATFSSIRGIIRATSGGGVTSAESRTYAAGVSGQRLENFLAVYNGTGAMKLYLNGYDDTLSNAFTAATGAVSSFNRVSLGGTDRGTDVFAGTGQNQALIVAWNRALSPAEALELSRNPWQLFMPQPRRFYLQAQSAAPGGFVAAWAANSNLILGTGTYA